MIDGWRYKEYLEQRKQALLTANLINGIGMSKKTIHVDDLCGYWVDGQVMSKMKYYEYSKKKAIRNKKGVS